MSSQDLVLLQASGKILAKTNFAICEKNNKTVDKQLEKRNEKLDAQRLRCNRRHVKDKKKLVNELDDIRQVKTPPLIAKRDAARLTPHGSFQIRHLPDWGSMESISSDMERAVMFKKLKEHQAELEKRVANFLPTTNS